MADKSTMTKQSSVTLKRLLPRLENRYSNKVEPEEWEGYLYRLNRHFHRLFNLLHKLYGHNYDFFFHLEDLLITATDMWINRPAELKALDATREADPLWFRSNRMMGAMCYVDLFSGTLKKLPEKIPYLNELGITYLHLMPLFKSPAGDNDGGYAVSSYRDVDAELGTTEELKSIATQLRHHGISLVLDFIFNHTSDEHEWAKKALKGDEDFQAYYRMFPDRKEPDEYEKTIRPVFEDDHPGCFTYRSKIRKWVWTTFHNYQWDLNYENPVVFNRMAEEMLFLANLGVEILRLDAVAFLWKKKGTSCENLDEAHTIIQAFNAVARIVAPATLFKSEAIVHPDEVSKYIQEDECQLSYNPQLMALLWEALATRDVSLLRHSVEKRFLVKDAIPGPCAWVNYIRCHDDIGWTFSNEDALEYNINPHDHRRFLQDFFIGRFEKSFAKGLPFQENKHTGDGRVSGTAASLCGLEKALKDKDDKEIALSIRRILLMHGVIISIGGIPILYLGDELGMLNDYGYSKSAEKVGDTRWVHRPVFNWKNAEKRRKENTIEQKIFSGLLKIIQIRKQNLAFSRSETEFVDTGNKAVFAYFRHSDEQSMFVIANFSETEQIISAKRLRLLGLRKTFTDIVAGKTITATQELVIEPYQFMILIGVF